MKKNLLLIIAMFMGFGLYAQIYEGNFDSYTSGDYLAEVDASWTTWTNQPGTAEDAVISNAFSESAPNSVLVQGTTDAVFPCGDLTSGAYTISFDYYVPAGKAAYFNLQHIFASEWAIESYLHADLTTRIIAGGQEISNVTFAANTWFHVQVDVNMNEDLATMYWDDVEIISWQWSLQTDGTAGANQLGCVNMYAGAEGTDSPQYYFDNFVFEELSDVIYFENFDEYTADEYLAVVDENWTTWTNQPGTAEDALISDDFAMSAPNSVKVTGTTDAVFPCGDLTSGSYSLSFDYYVPAGKAGYYNVQHIFASEWAIECYLHADLTSRIIAGGQEISNVTFDANTWFNVQVDIDLDADLATMYWDGVEIISWQWSLQTDGTAGANQLGCVNMYAGAEGTDSPLYYFDNFTFVSLSSALTPATVQLDTDEIMVEINDGVAVTEMFNIANIGQQDMAYTTYPIYDVPAATGTATGEMAHCGDFDSGIGSDGAVARKIAVLFGPSVMEEYIGTELTSIEFYMADQGLDLQVKVWARGATTVPGPGEEIYSAPFTPTVGMWNTATLSTPILLDGTPIYVGVSYFQPAGIYAFGSDIGPKVPGVNWSSTGPGWSEFSLDRNWTIRANVTGDPYNTFMDIPIDAGMIIPGGDENVVVFFDPTDLDAGQYTGEIVVATNDPVTNYATISVTLDIVTATNEVNKTDALTVYPNPTSNLIHVQADGIISEVVVTNYLGQVVDVQTLSNNQTTVDLSQLENGVYFLEVKTDAANHSVKVVKK